MPAVLVVDDDEAVRTRLAKLFNSSGFEAKMAANVAEALEQIQQRQYDVLISDLNMHGAGDGLTVIGAMRHLNPRAITFILSDVPDLIAATTSLMSHVDEIVSKSTDHAELVALVQHRLAGAPSARRLYKNVAAILQSSAQNTIELWLDCVHKDERLMGLSISDAQRCGHLPLLFRSLIDRLNSPVPLGGKSQGSPEAVRHGIDRHKQGYSPDLIVEESRLLQNSIFRILQDHLRNIPFETLLPDVMTIADEVDVQLSQTIKSFVAADVTLIYSLGNHDSSVS